LVPMLGAVGEYRSIIKPKKIIELGNQFTK